MKKKAKKAKDKKLEKKIEKKMESACCSKFNNSCGGGVWFLGFIGAAVYYISTATGFWNGVWGFLKALVWPAFLVFEALKYMG